MADLPELSTERLRIVPLGEEFLTERYVSWLNDPDVLRFSEQRHRRHDLASCRQYWASFKGSPNFFSAMLTHSPEPSHIGNISVSVDAPNRVADIAIMIGERSLWGKGYGSEAWCVVVNELLTHQGIRKITAGAMSINHGMLTVMERCGMHVEAVRRRQFILDGNEVDLVMTAVFANKR